MVSPVFSVQEQKLQESSLKKTFGGVSGTTLRMNKTRGVYENTCSLRKFLFIFELSLSYPPIFS